MFCNSQVCLLDTWCFLLHFKVTSQCMCPSYVCICSIRTWNAPYYVLHPVSCWLSDGFESTWNVTNHASRPHLLKLDFQWAQLRFTLLSKKCESWTLHRHHSTQWGANIRCWNRKNQIGVVTNVTCPVFSIYTSYAVQDEQGNAVQLSPSWLFVAFALCNWISSIQCGHTFFSVLNGLRLEHCLTRQHPSLWICFWLVFNQNINFIETAPF